MMAAVAAKIHTPLGRWQQFLSSSNGSCWYFRQYCQSATLM